MAITIGASLQLFDKFSSKLTVVRKSMNSTITVAEKLKRQIEAPIAMRVDVSGAINSLKQVGDQMKASNDIAAKIGMRTITFAVLGFDLGIDKLISKIDQLILALTPSKSPGEVSGGQQGGGGNGSGLMTGIAASIGIAADRASGTGGTGGSFGEIMAMSEIAAAISEVVSVMFQGMVGGAMEQRQAVDTFTARTGNAEHGQAIYDRIVGQALDLKQDPNQAISGTMGFMNDTMDPTKLAQLNKLSLRLSKLNPGEGFEAAASSVKDLLGGDIRSMSDTFGIDESALMSSDALKSGKAEDVEGFIKGMDKLLNQQKMTEEAFEKMLDSPVARWQGIVGRFKDEFAKAGAGALAVLNPLFSLLEKGFKAGSLNPFFKVLSWGLTLTAVLIRAVVSSLVWLGSVLDKYWPVFAAMLLTIAMFYLPLIITRIRAMALTAWGAATAAWATVLPWIAANWAMLAVVAAVGLLVYWMIQSGVTAGEMVGGIVGAFGVLKIHIQNVLIYIMNRMAILGDFLHNVMIDPVYAIQKYFWDLGNNFFGILIQMTRAAEEFASGFANVVGKGINKVLEGVDWIIAALALIPGFDSLKGFKTEKVDEDNQFGVSEYLKSLQADYQSFKPTSDMDVQETQLIPYKTGADYKAAWDTGFQQGQKFVDGAKKMFKDFPDPSKSQSTDIKKIGEIGKVGEVGNINDEVDISSEDLKLMRDLAEMKAIQNYVTLTPTVQVTTGPINQEVDVAKVTRQIAETMTAEVRSSTQGMFG